MPVACNVLMYTKCCQMVMLVILNFNNRTAVPLCC
jgi:hypothetical protein